MTKVLFDSQTQLVQQQPQRYKSLGDLSQQEAQQLARVVFGNGPGVELLASLDQRYSQGTGTLIKRELALAQHEGGLRFGRENPDPHSGYNFGTYQIGGLNSSPQESLAKYERNLQAGLALYTQMTGKQANPATLSTADRDLISHLGYIHRERQFLYNGNSYEYSADRPQGQIFQDLGNPNLSRPQQIALMSEGIQGGINRIGIDVVRMQEELVIDLQSVNHASQQGRMLPQSIVREGDRGQDVRNIQAALQRMGQKVEVTGTYDQDTTGAVRAVQASKGVVADGVVGPNTWAVLEMTPQSVRQPSPGQAVGNHARPTATSRPDASLRSEPLGRPASRPEMAAGQGLGRVAQNSPNPDRQPPGRPANQPATQPMTPSVFPAIHAAAGRALPTVLPSNYLQQGSRGQPVKVIQTFLNQVQGEKLAVDGWFGNQTEEALRRYQQSRKIGVDGIYGPETRAAMLNDLQRGIQHSQAGQSLGARIAQPSAPNTSANSSTGTIKLSPLVQPSGETYYGAPREYGRLHAGFDSYDPTRETSEQSPQATFGGVVINVDTQYDDNGNLAGYGNYVDIYNARLNIVERIAEMSEVLVKENQPVFAGQVVGRGADQTTIIHREIRPKEAYDRNPYGYEGTLDWRQFVIDRGLYRPEADRLEPTSKVLPQQVTPIVEPTQFAQAVRQVVAMDARTVTQANGDRVLNGSTYTIQSSGNGNLVVSTPDRGRILQIEGNQIRLNQVNSQDQAIMAQTAAQLQQQQQHRSSLAEGLQRLQATLQQRNRQDGVAEPVTAGLSAGRMLQHTKQTVCPAVSSPSQPAVDRELE